MPNPKDKKSKGKNDKKKVVEAKVEKESKKGGAKNKAIAQPDLPQAMIERIAKVAKKEGKPAGVLKPVVAEVVSAKVKAPPKDGDKSAGKGVAKTAGKTKEGTKLPAGINAAVVDAPSPKTSPQKKALDKKAVKQPPVIETKKSPVAKKEIKKAAETKPLKQAIGTNSEPWPADIKAAKLPVAKKASKPTPQINGGIETTLKKEEQPAQEAKVARTDTKQKKTSKKLSDTPLKYEDIHFVDSQKPVWNYSRFAPEDIQNYHQGTLYRAYDLFGSHELEVLNTKGYYFAVWAPNATSVSVIGNFNDWQPHAHELYPRLDQTGIWEGFIPKMAKGEAYKYHIVGYQGMRMDKGDPYALFWEKKPATASITWNIEGYRWNDAMWMSNRKNHNNLKAPWNVYEVHLASWMRPDKNNEDSYNTYAQITERLVPYVKEMGFTHVELMPIMEHPYDGSWGYQGTGYFAPTSRFGCPEDFMAMVDAFHKESIGVILDWVPSHFPYDSHGLYMFDGTHTYEYADMRKGYHPDWSSYIFNYKRNEVKCFLISSARYWFEKYHIDGIRVDAVSSMLKLDYSRKEGEWEPNEFGGNGNLEAIAFLKELNETIYRDFEGVQTIAEEATDWPGVTNPTFAGGLGFGMKWMMGWMHDTLNYFKRDPLFRKDHQDQFTFSMVYYYDENFMLPLSHDEIVHGKSPMVYKMPGDEWQKFANLRALYAYMFTHPGGKLLFMGNEFGSTNEWNHKSELQWELLQYNSHNMLREFVKDMLHLVRRYPAFYEKQFEHGGFEWVETNRRQESVLAYIRKGNDDKGDVLVVLNLTPVVRHDFSIWVNGKGKWKEIMNSNDSKYWGSGDVFNPDIKGTLVDKKLHRYELKLNLPALGVVILG